MCQSASEGHQLIGNDSNNVPGHVETLCTGQYGSHKMCTGRVTQLHFAGLCSRERTRVIISVKDGI